MNFLRIIFMFGVVGLCFKSLDFTSLKENQVSRSIDSVKEQIQVQKIEKVKKEFLKEFENLYVSTETSIIYEDYHSSY